MMPTAGGMYVYLREAFSPLLGFLYGWTLLTVIQTGSIAAVAIAFARFSGVMFPSISETHYFIPPIRILPGYAFSLSSAQAVALAIILITCFINTRGVTWGKLVQNIFTVAKLAGMVVLLGLGAYAFVRNPSVFHSSGQSTPPPASAFSSRSASRRPDPCSPRTPGTTSRSLPARCATPSATCRWPWASAPRW
jgi:APA family basic amino acid/polyamine antiporter